MPVEFKSKERPEAKWTCGTAAEDRSERLWEARSWVLTRFWPHFEQDKKLLGGFDQMTGVIWLPFNRTSGMETTEIMKASNDTDLDLRVGYGDGGKGWILGLRRKGGRQDCWWTRRRVWERGLCVFCLLRNRAEQSLTETAESVGSWGKNRGWFGHGHMRCLLVTQEEMYINWISLSVSVCVYSLGEKSRLGIYIWELSIPRQYLCTWEWMGLLKA